jgi:hypothetical protein
MAYFEPRRQRASDGQLLQLASIRGELEGLHRHIRFQQQIPGDVSARVDEIHRELEENSVSTPTPALLTQRT